MTVTEIIRPELQQMIVEYAEHYKRDGKGFVNCFVKFKSMRSVLGLIVKEFEDTCKPYEPDENISNYVGKLGLQPMETRLLARVLKMIKLVTE